MRLNLETKNRMFRWDPKTIQKNASRTSTFADERGRWVMIVQSRQRDDSYKYEFPRRERRNSPPVSRLTCGACSSPRRRRRSSRKLARFLPFALQISGPHLHCGLQNLRIMQDICQICGYFSMVFGFFWYFAVVFYWCCRIRYGTDKCSNLGRCSVVPSKIINSTKECLKTTNWEEFNTFFTSDWFFLNYYCNIGEIWGFGIK